ncbi:GDSL-type esterase/lipase family protein [Kitasatospora sp. NBC_00240]|uniref:GDSL-type esterase/lipase family protein n=1 Tax=Kitasatospora sp. NBC_00240 TaxID=2903567 RepID=UPI00224DEB5E|nr:GDSL-type esterase/lipase family protein [Kitasatospora sp. NBC_00240]MCX5208081.1 GDSL-type esterase/lipase family protein [Kitasatospora sp. NBC_00240]
MPLVLPPGATVLFQGDSITDAGRDRYADTHLGDGYAALAAERLRAARPGVTVLNRAVSGDRVRDLRARWERDTLAHRPALLSVMVGVNDTWRQFDLGEPSPVEIWERDYRQLLTGLRERYDTRLVLIEPFVVPVIPQQWAWREDLDPRIHAVRRLAAEFDARLLAADGLLNQAARAAGGPEAIADDGVHPTPLGHRVLADAWADLVLGS